MNRMLTRSISSVVNMNLIITQLLCVALVSAAPFNQKLSDRDSAMKEFDCLELFGETDEETESFRYVRVYYMQYGNCCVMVSSVLRSG